ncbi:MAG: hypothetical protein QXG76_02285 [Candidatus Bathyarchaeia archaeon]
MWSDVACPDHLNVHAAGNVFSGLCLEDAQACILNAKFQEVTVAPVAANL